MILNLAMKCKPKACCLALTKEKKKCKLQNDIKMNSSIWIHKPVKLHKLNNRRIEVSSWINHELRWIHIIHHNPNNRSNIIFLPIVYSITCYHTYMDRTKMQEIFVLKLQEVITFSMISKFNNHFYCKFIM